jgi:hypothetical protein
VSPASFPPDELALLAREEEVEIETRTPDGRVRRTVIWVVVDDTTVYVRSVRGKRGRWWQRMMNEPLGAVHVAGRRIPVRAVPATDPTSIEACSRALAEKYAGDPSTRLMLEPETLPTTSRLTPT